MALTIGSPRRPWYPWMLGLLPCWPFLPSTSATAVFFATCHAYGGQTESLALARSFSVALLNCPQAAMMSRPRGVRTGLA
jgi:hypothetical protein